jgi:hypothetical protein
MGCVRPARTQGGGLAGRRLLRTHRARDRCHARERPLGEGKGGRQLERAASASTGCSAAWMTRARCCGRAMPARTPPKTREHILMRRSCSYPREVLLEDILGGATHDFAQTCRDGNFRSWSRSSPRRSARRCSSRPTPLGKRRSTERASAARRHARQAGGLAVGHPPGAALEARRRHPRLGADRPAGHVLRRTPPRRSTCTATDPSPGGTEARTRPSGRSTSRSLPRTARRRAAIAPHRCPYRRHRHPLPATRPQPQPPRLDRHLPT